MSLKTVKLSHTCAGLTNMLTYNIEWQIVYFTHKIQKAIMSWTPELVAHYLHITRLMQLYGPNLGMPHTRAMGKGLFEIRIKSLRGIARVFYCTNANKQIIILHGYIKKTQKTPAKELMIAYRRLKEYQNA